MSLKLLIPITLLCFVTCCTEKQSNSNAPGKKFELKKNAVKEFRLDSVTSFRTNYLDLFEKNGESYLVFENRNKPSIQFYEFENGALAFEINLETDGPNGVGKMRGFYVKSVDSIYVLSPFHYAVYLIDRQGKIIDKYSWLRSEDPVKSSSLAGIYTTSPGLVLANKLHMFAVPETGYTKKVTFESGKVDLALDLNAKSIELGYQYPESYRKNMFGNLFLKIDRALTNRETIIYSFGADNYLYETNYSDKNIPHFAGSTYFKETMPLEDLSQADDHQIMTGYFAGIKYDKYRNLYYRLAVHPIELLNADNQRNHFEDKRISVIILDGEFNVVGETILPDKLHLYTTWFVGEKGLYISNHNKNNDEVNENSLSFTIYEPVSIQ